MNEMPTQEPIKCEIFKIECALDGLSAIIDKDCLKKKYSSIHNLSEIYLSTLKNGETSKNCTFNDEGSVKIGFGDCQGVWKKSESDYQSFIVYVNHEKIVQETEISFMDPFSFECQFRPFTLTNQMTVLDRDAVKDIEEKITIGKTINTIKRVRQTFPKDLIFSLESMENEENTKSDGESLSSSSKRRSWLDKRLILLIIGKNLLSALFSNSRGPQYKPCKNC